MPERGKRKSDDRFGYKVNEEICCHGNVRVLEDGKEPSIMHINDARKLAESRELDLMLITDKSDVPVVRICDYEKAIYALKKNAKKQQPKPLKEIELSVNIADHDLDTKVNQARKFLESGHKVKVTLKMKGRELTRREENKKSILKFIVKLEDVSIPEGQLKDEGNRTVVILKKK